MSAEVGQDPFTRPPIGASRFAQAPASTAQDTRSDATEEATHKALARSGHDEIGTRGQDFGMASDGGELTFETLLDVINPLHHIPVVSTLYREMTGDEISTPAEVLGGLIYGGPLGLVASMANAIAREESGEDLGSLAMSAIFGGDEDGEGETLDPDIAVIDEAIGPPLETASGGEAPGQRPAAGTSGVPPAEPATENNSKGAAIGGASGAPLTGMEALQSLARDLKSGGVLSGGPQTPEPGVLEAIPQGEGARGHAMPHRVPKVSEALPAPNEAQTVARAASAAATTPSSALAWSLETPDGPGLMGPAPVRQVLPSDMLIGGDPDGSFADRMLEALQKYEGVRRQNSGS